MTKGQKILLWLGVGGVTIGFLIYRSKQNEKEGQIILDYINKSMTQNDLSKAVDEGIKSVQGTALDPSKIKLTTASGNITDPKVSDAMAKLNVQIYSAIKGISTDTKSLFNALLQIKNKNTLAFMDKVFKAQYGQGLFEMMKQEYLLYNTTYGKFSDKTNNALDTIPFLNDGYWNPAIAKWINSLPNY